MQQYDKIKIWYRDDSAKTKEITAQKITFKGFEQFSFYLHPDIHTPGAWIVTEQVTGRRVTSGALTQVRRKARKILVEYGPEQLGERIAYYLFGAGREEYKQ